MVRVVRAALVLTVVWTGLAAAADWPAYRRDANRSGVTSETLNPPLHPHWTYQPGLAPKPAWPAPAKTDYFHRLFNLTPAVTYDRAFHVCAAEGLVCFGSSADDCVYALDAATGETRWTFRTEGPVRLAPAYANGRVYFGSDDGRAYCLEAATGELVWTWRPEEPLRLIPGNGRLISDRPMRAGVLVKDGVVYLCAGIFPAQTVKLCALDTATGEPLWLSDSGQVSAQGYMLASPSYLFVPTGRTHPAIFDRATGEHLGGIESSGGAFAVLTGGQLLSGPGRGSKDALVAADPETREAVASFPGTGLVVDAGVAYLQSREAILALDRGRYAQALEQRATLEHHIKQLEAAIEDAESADDNAQAATLRTERQAAEATLETIPASPEECAAWRTQCAFPYALIKAGGTLYAGGEGAVAGLDADTGAVVWRAEIPGRAYGLAVSGGRLYVSTDAGAIHCFAAAPAEGVMRRTQQYHAPAYAGDAAAARTEAKQLAQAAGTDKGYAILVTPPSLDLAYALAEETDFHAAVVLDSPEAAAQAAEELAGTGLYGARLAVHAWENRGRLPYATGVANLVVAYPGASGEPPVTAAEAVRVARPFGGTVVVPAGAGREWLARGADAVEEGGGWYAAQRGPVPGAGEWTQLYADAGHTACSQDALRGPFAVQWFGQPGPRPMIDRHHRPMSSLFKNGRLFITGDERVITVDAYNGAPLWQLEAPGSRRIGSLKNAGHQLVTDEAFFLVAGNACWVVDPETGQRQGALEAPALLGGRQEWGYLNAFGNLLLGTAQHKGANFSENSIFTCALLEGDHRPVVVSDAVFAVDRDTGEPAWTHARGAYMNAAIALAGQRLCFVEARSGKAIEDDTGRMRIDDFLAGSTTLTALDAATGAVAWEQPVDYGFEHILFVNATPEIVLVSGAYNKEVDGETQVFYHLYAYRAVDGAPMWDTPFRATNIRGTDWAGPGGTHGENWQHPVISGATIYARPYAFDLATGKKLDYMLYRGGHGCGGLTGSAHYLYGRGDNPRAYPVNVAETEGIQLTRVTRPGCWLNIIPAGGLVLIPESSSGCTCAYPMQTSIALAPRSWAQGAAGDEGGAAVAAR